LTIHVGLFVMLEDAIAVCGR